MMDVDKYIWKDQIFLKFISLFRDFTRGYFILITRTIESMATPTPEEVRDKQIKVFILAVVLFALAIAILIFVLCMLRRHQKQIDAKLFNFNQASKSKYGDDSFIDNKGAWESFRSLIACDFLYLFFKASII